MVGQSAGPGRSDGNGSLSAGQPPWTLAREASKGHVLIVEDDEDIRESMAPFLEGAGYEVSLAENGRDALRRLNAGPLPDIIMLDLRMPVMDGWQFRILQKDDPKLGHIPVVAISADGSAQAAAISARAYLRKPVPPKELLATIARVLFEDRRQAAALLSETQRLTSLGRLAAGVGHEINNPLTFVMLNLSQSLEMLRPRGADQAPSSPDGASFEIQLAEMKTRTAVVSDMLQDCQVGAERIRETIDNLYQLSRPDASPHSSIDLNKVIEHSVAMAWNEIRHRARLVKVLGQIPTVPGNEAALSQVFLNLLLNAAQSIPEGRAEAGEIRVSTSVDTSGRRNQVVVEISDSGAGIAADVIDHVFEPFFTTKPTGKGSGLGLSISRQTVSDHGGRITVDSNPGMGTTVRVFLPTADGAGATPSPITEPETTGLPARGRVLVIDDEPMIGRVIRNCLKKDHDVIVVQRASEALERLENGETFDMVLCDVVMPDLTGPEFYAQVEDRWPEIAARLVFMTGGAFTPATTDFMERVPTRVLSKPFKVEGLRRLVRERIRGNA